MKTPLNIRPASSDFTVRLSAKLSASTSDLFEKYCQAYKKEYGTDAPKDYIVNQIFLSFFKSDKGFQAYLKSGAGEQETKD